MGGSTKKLFLDLVANEKVVLIDFEAENDTRINVKMFANNATYEINGARAKINDN